MRWTGLLLLLLSACAATPILDHGFIQGDLGDLRWPNLPLLIIADPSIVELQAAIDWWHARVGRPLFVIVPFETPIELVSVIVSHTDETHRGLTKLYWAGSTLTLALCEIPSKAPLPIYRKILRHELGHALGLDHDDDWTSIMHGLATPYGNENLSAQDIDRLRRL